MVKRKISIRNITGLDLQPAGIFCKTAMRFKSKVTLRYKDTDANAKSLLSVLGSGIIKGDEIELLCDGEDEDEAMDAMVKVIEDRLGE